MKRHSFLKFTSLIVGMGCITIPMLLSSCSERQGIIFANFESYMSTELGDELRTIGKNPVSFVYYPTNEDIEMKFKKYYDLAIPSSYEVITLLKKHQLAKIDWTQFGQFDPEHETIWNDIHNGAEALNHGIFSETTQLAIGQIDSYLIEKNIIKDDETILDYAVPYFLQDWMFAYKGYAGYNENPNLANAASWSDVLDVISPKGSHFDQRFKPSGGKKIGLVDDLRSIYDMCRLIQTNNKTVNPPDKRNEISDFKNTYRYLTSKFKKDDNYFYLNSDSYQILYALADPKGLSSSIAYNGDALYAAIGAGVPEWEDKHNADNFFVSIPQTTLVAMDMVVLNKDMETMSQSKKQDMYHLLWKTTLDGCFDANNDTGIGKKENDSFIHGPMTNFDYVFYTSPLTNLDQYALDGDYFDVNFPEKYDLLKEIYRIPKDIFSADILELPLDGIDKSNMYQAYIEEKGNV